MMKLLLVLAIALGYTAYHFAGETPGGAPSALAETRQGEISQGDVLERSGSSAGQAAILQAYADHRSEVQVQASAIVSKLLADDTQGARHQRFLVRLADGHSLLLVHNIDLAPRLDDLKAGDQVEFNGVYEWNAKGGLVHWTHHDPQGRHAAGWIRHHGRIYQ